MKTVIQHKTPQNFIDETFKILKTRELENNLLIGVCNGIPNLNEENSRFVFLSRKDENGELVCSMKTISKALIGGTSLDENSIKDIAEFYINNKIEITGVVGEKEIATKFSKFYSKGIDEIKELISHKLDQVNEVKLSDGTFLLCNDKDISLLTDWTYQFQFDINNYPIKDKVELKGQAESIVKNNSFFKRVVDNETKSIASIIRQTQNYGIIGAVYTPKNERKKGYASSLVCELSKYILQSKKFCGLYTDKANPTSNKIYQNIGYNPIGESLDIKFKED